MERYFVNSRIGLRTSKKNDYFFHNLHSNSVSYWHEGKGYGRFSWLVSMFPVNIHIDPIWEQFLLKATVQLREVLYKNGTIQANL